MDNTQMEIMEDDVRMKRAKLKVEREKILKFLTSSVRKEHGSAEALKFYVDHVQPMKKYFEGKE